MVRLEVESVALVGFDHLVERLLLLDLCLDLPFFVVI